MKQIDNNQNKSMAPNKNRQLSKIIRVIYFKKWPTNKNINYQNKMPVAH